MEQQYQKTAFLYAGQGAQKIGMGKDLYEEFPTFRKVLDQADLPFDWKKIMWEGDEATLTRTEYTQPCLALIEAGITEVLKEHKIVPQYAAGLSLGEYGALYAAGVFSCADFLKTVTFRGAAMQRAAEGKVVSMSAVLGAEQEDIEDLCARVEKNGCFVTVVNYNCPGQYVICGEADAVEAVENLVAEEKKGKCRRLAVGAPFHTKLLKAASEELEQFLRQMELREPQIPVAMNVTGSFYQKQDSLQDMLVKQAISSVRMEADINCLLDAGVDRFIEIGPGGVLSGFVKRCLKKRGGEAQVLSIGSAEDLWKLIRE